MFSWGVSLPKTDRPVVKKNRAQIDSNFRLLAGRESGSGFFPQARTIHTGHPCLCPRPDSMPVWLAAQCARYFAWGTKYTVVGGGLFLHRIFVIRHQQHIPFVSLAPHGLSFCRNIWKKKTFVTLCIHELILISFFQLSHGLLFY